MMLNWASHCSNRIKLIATLLQMYIWSCLKVCWRENLLQVMWLSSTVTWLSNPSIILSNMYAQQSWEHFFETELSKRPTREPFYERWTLFLLNNLHINQSSPLERGANQLVISPLKCFHHTWSKVIVQSTLWLYILIYKYDPQARTLSVSHLQCITMCANGGIYKVKDVQSRTLACWLRACSQ